MSSLTRERVFQFEARVLEDALLFLPLEAPLGDFVEEDFAEDGDFDASLAPDLLFDEGTGSRRLSEDEALRR